MPDNLCAHVLQDILELHQNVDQNVSFHRNVHLIRRASITNALIRAHIHVVSDLFVMLAIIIQFALVQLVSPAIHSHNAP